MQKGDLMRTPSGKVGPIVDFPMYGRPGENGAVCPFDYAQGRRRVQLALVCRIDGDTPILIRVAYDPRDLQAVEATP